MLRVLPILSLILSVSLAKGQGVVKCPVAPDNYMPGDPVAAQKACRPAVEDTFSKPVVRLGYLYRDTVTRDEFDNNLQVGLRMMRYKNYKIIGFHISRLSRGGDYNPGVDVEGPIINYQAYRDMHLIEVKSGDRIYIGAKAIVDGETKVRLMNDVKIVIR